MGNHDTDTHEQHDLLIEIYPRIAEVISVEELAKKLKSGGLGFKGVKIIPGSMSSAVLHLGT
tara:strand:+ start:240 stop:425 length:186 start_codon:yes stop_codon:yes gene_type:complete